MSQPSEHLIKTLEEFKAQLAAKINDAKRILATINMIEEMIGVPKTAVSEISARVSFEDAVGLSDSVSVDVARPRVSLESLRPDEYLGETPLEAAKKYLRRVGMARPFDEIANAVQKGSAATVGANWRDALQESLLRSTRDIVKIQNGIFGLVDFYTLEQLSRLRGTRRQRPANEDGGSGKTPRRKKRKTSTRKPSVKTKTRSKPKAEANTAQQTETGDQGRS